jgi:hypothetical protein
VSAPPGSVGCPRGGYVGGNHRGGVWAGWAALAGGPGEQDEFIAIRAGDTTVVKQAFQLRRRPVPPGQAVADALVLAGWTSLRFTWHDLTNRPGAVVAEIRRRWGRGQRHDRQFWKLEPIFGLCFQNS